MVVGVGEPDQLSRYSATSCISPLVSVPEKPGMPPGPPLVVVLTNWVKLSEVGTRLPPLPP